MSQNQSPNPLPANLEATTDRGSGVLVARGGYRTVGGVIELPTVSGSKELERQDGPMAPLVFVAGDPEAAQEMSLASAALAPPARDDVPTAQPVAPPEVQPEPCRIPEPSFVQSTPLVEVTLKHSSGFTMSSKWDLVIVEPAKGESSASTLVLAADPGRGSYVFPVGDYDITVDHSDTYRAYFGNQSFQYGLVYYIFVVQLND